MADINFKGVKFIRPEVLRLSSQYRLISDCLSGEVTVKAQGVTYLPDPSDMNCDKTQSKSRYENYLKRAVYYNFTRRTMAGLVGQIFSKPVTIKGAETGPMNLVCKSIGGDGVSAAQQSKRAVEYVIGLSRAGLLVDFPNTGGVAISRADVDSGVALPTVTLYGAEQITNWKTIEIGAETIVNLLVLAETHQIPDTADPEFGTVTAIWYRVFRLTQSGVTQQLYKPVANQMVSFGSTEYQADPPVTMLGQNGQPLRRIPFVFLGLTANSVDVEDPSFYDLASLNIAHYRNSADYEENIFVAGQSTLTANGLTKDWIDKVLGGKVAVGAYSFLPLPVGGNAAYIQPKENGIIKEAMDQKERQAVALGAKLVEQKDVQRTATEARIESTSEGSVLMSAAKNVSAGYTEALKIAASFLGLAPDAIEFSLNSDFDIAKMSSEDRDKVVTRWIKGALAFSEMRNVLQAGGEATLTPDEARKEIKADAVETSEFEVDKAKALATAVGSVNEKQPTIP